MSYKLSCQCWKGMRSGKMQQNWALKIKCTCHHLIIGGLEEKRNEEMQVSENCWGLKNDERPQTERAHGEPNKINVVNLHLDTLWGNLKPQRKRQNSQRCWRKRRSLTRKQVSDWHSTCVQQWQERQKAGMYYYQSAKELQTRFISRKKMK